MIRSRQVRPSIRRHVHIERDDVRRATPERPQSLDAIAGEPNFEIALRTEELQQQFPHQSRIVDDQQPDHELARRSARLSRSSSSRSAVLGAVSNSAGRATGSCARSPGAVDHAADQPAPRCFAGQVGGGSIARRLRARPRRRCRRSGPRDAVRRERRSAAARPRRTCGMSKRRRWSTTGKTSPRRLMTPSRNPGIFGTRVNPSGNPRDLIDGLDRQSEFFVAKTEDQKWGSCRRAGRPRRSVAGWPTRSMRSIAASRPPGTDFQARAARSAAFRRRRDKSPRSSILRRCEPTACAGGAGRSRPRRRAGRAPACAVGDQARPELPFTAGRRSPSRARSGRPACVRHNPSKPRSDSSGSSVSRQAATPSKHGLGTRHDGNRVRQRNDLPHCVQRQGRIPGRRPRTRSARRRSLRDGVRGAVRSRAAARPRRVLRRVAIA